MVLPFRKVELLDSESHIWITKRASRLEFENVPQKATQIALQIKVMSPWKDQQLEIVGKNWRHSILLNEKNPRRMANSGGRTPGQCTD